MVKTNRALLQRSSCSCHSVWLDKWGELQESSNLGEGIAEDGQSKHDHVTSRQQIWLSWSTSCFHWGCQGELFIWTSKVYYWHVVHVLLPQLSLGLEGCESLAQDFKEEAAVVPHESFRKHLLSIWGRCLIIQSVKIVLIEQRLTCGCKLGSERLDRF